MKRLLPLLIVTSLYSQWFSVAGCNNDGDLDSDGELEFSDITAIQNLILEAGYSEIADANTDNELSVTDLLHFWDWYFNDSYPCFQRFIFDDDILEFNHPWGVLQDVNGDYLLKGNLSDIYGLIKLDDKGYPIDTIVYDYGPPRYFIEDVGEGYVMCGPNWDDVEDIRIVKIGYDGSLLWENSYGYENLNFKQIINTFDGGYAVIADHLNQYQSLIGITVCKIHPSGSLDWIENYDSVGEAPRASSIIQRPDSGFVLLSISYDFSPLLIITQIDKNGNFESSINLFDDANIGNQYGGIVYNDGHYYLFVSTYIMKFDLDFNYISYFNVGTTASGGYSMHPHVPRMILNNNIFALTGKVGNGPLADDYLFMSYNLEGELINSTTADLLDDQAGISLCATNDGGYFIAIEGFGYIKTDSTGQVPIWLLED